MGILDDLAMGFGFKEKDRDYYDRTAATISRDQGSDAGDRYRSSISERYAAAPNYGTAIGPSVSDFRQVANPGRDPYTSGGRLRSDFQPGSLAQTYRDANLPQPGTFMHKLTNTPTLMGILARIIGGYDARRRKASCGRRIGRRSSRRRSSSLWRQLLRRQRPHAPK